MTLLKPVLPTLRLTLVLALVTGIAFPFLLERVSLLIFPEQSTGSLLKAADGHILGSRLIGQNFVASRYFHPRPSAAGSGYTAESSSGTNLGPTSAKLMNGDKDFPSIAQLADVFRKENGLAASAAVPVDAVTRSGSGLDPDISPENALLQAPRVAKARSVPETTVIDLVKQHTQTRQLGFLGEERVNVLLLNLEMDKLGSRM
jgi:K+-transporting ATPase ATPase C chain